VAIFCLRVKLKLAGYVQSLRNACDNIHQGKPSPDRHLTSTMAYIAELFHAQFIGCYMVV